jgi:hypothetical protein
MLAAPRGGADVDEGQIREELVAIAGELRRWWVGALELKVARDLYDELAPALGGDHSHVGVQVASWYRDALLIRCRRLVAGGKDDESLRKTLQRLERLAGHVTAGTLVDSWMEQGTTLDRSQIERLVAEALERGRRGGGDVLDPATVGRDGQRLQEDHAALTRFASRTVAHLDRRRHKAEPPTIADVDRLVDDVLELVRRYAGVIAGVDLRPEPPTVGGKPTVRALELFDWKGYVEAVSDEVARRWDAFSCPPGGWEQVENDVELRFVWPDADGDC